MKRFAAVILVLVLLTFAGGALAEETIEIGDGGGNSQVQTGDAVSFNCTVESANYTWNFGDGTVMETNTSSVTHVYHSSGDYTVSVSAGGRNFTYSITAIDAYNTGGGLLALVGAGLAVGVAGMGAGIGVGIAGASAAGATANQPKKFGKFFVFQNLAQTQAIYGLLTAILIMLGTGMFGGEKDVPMGVGLIAIGAGLAVGIAGLSAIGQGIAAAGSIGALARKDEAFGRGMVFSALPETQAIYGLLVAILLIFFSGMFGGGYPEYYFGLSGIAIGLVGIGAGLAVGIAGLSAIGQGIAAGSGIGVASERPELFGRSIVFSALPETQAIYGILIAILLLVFGGVMSGPAFGDLGGEMGYIGYGLIAVGAGLAVGIAGLSAIGQGIAASSAIGSSARKPELFGKSLVFAVLPETQAIYGLLIAILLLVFSGMVGGGISEAFSGSTAFTLGLIAVAAGLATGIAGLSAIGQGIAASAGIGGTARKPEMFGKNIVFAVLPETQAIYGLLVAILLIIFTGFIGITRQFNLSDVGIGYAAVGAGLAIGIAGLSAIGQGITAASGISATVKGPENFGKSVIFSVMSETFAIFGLLIAILIIIYAGIMG